jgi:hypothetical protein
VAQKKPKAKILFVGGQSGRGAADGSSSNGFRALTPGIRISPSLIHGLECGGDLLRGGFVQRFAVFPPAAKFSAAQWVRRQFYVFAPIFLSFLFQMAAFIQLLADAAKGQKELHVAVL